jgi:hypothetical protein
LVEMNQPDLLPLPKCGAAEPAAGGPLLSAQALLRSLNDSLASVGLEQLIETYERVERAYDDFPELELECPRDSLVEKLRSTADALPDEAAVPLLMFCVALVPYSTSSVSALLSGMARSGDSQAIASVVRMLARKRDFTWNEIAPAMEQLRRQGSMGAALAIISEVLGRLHLAPDAGSVELGNILKGLLIDDDEVGDIDPSLFAGVARSARSRLREPTQRRSQSYGGDALLSLAERVSAKLSGSRLSPPSAVLPPRSVWPSGRLAFAEFAAQWSNVSGIEVDWLPMMRVGDAGERIDGMLRAKPGHKGHIVYGPYFRLPPGEYHARARMTSGRSWRWLHQRQPVATLEAVANGNDYLAQRDVSLQESRGPQHEFSFVVGEAAGTGNNLVEIRVWTNGTVPLSLSSITVERLSPALLRGLRS